MVDKLTSCNAPLKDHCLRSNVAFYFKQWGGTNKKKAGKTLEGKVYVEMPQIIE
jgi:protein gp37